MRYGFFDSKITGYDTEGLPVFDRAEDAEFFALFFAAYFTNGVFPSPSDQLQVYAPTDGSMSVIVKPGRVNINGYIGLEDTARTLVVQAAESMDRIDRIVARLDLNNRLIDLYVVKGTAATAPVAPDLNRPVSGQSGDIYEMGLANVFIAKNTTSITQERITDTRLDTDVCGLVTQAITSIDTATYYEQLEAMIAKYNSIIAAALDETLAGQIMAKLTRDVTAIAAIPVTAFVADTTFANYPFKAEIAVAGATSNDVPDVQPSQDASDLGILGGKALASTGIVTIYANAVPSAAIVIDRITLRKENI